MKTARGLFHLARTVGWRLLIVLVLALAVSGATYGIAGSTVGTAMSSNTRRPPGRAESQTPQVATTTPADQTGVSSSTVASADPQPAQTAQPQRLAGGQGGPGRGPSLTRGLPQLAVHAAVIAVIVLVGNGARQLWLSLRRRRGGTRAPVFRHAGVGQ